MKIGISMKSNFAYERLKSELQKYEVYRHLSSINDIQEETLHSKPDLMILDERLPFYEDAERILLKFNVHIIRFRSDFESVIKEVNEQSIFFTEDIDIQEEKYIPDHTKYIQQLNQKLDNDKETEKQIIYKEKIVEKEVQRLSYTNIPKKIIVIGSLWSGAGSTTVTTNLAKAIAKRDIQVSFIEYPTLKPYMFDYLSIHERENEEKKKVYVDHARVIREKGIFQKEQYWNEDGIYWFVNDSRYPMITNYQYEEMIRLIYSIPTPIILVDISTEWNDPEVKKFLHHADEIFICVEPNPIKIDWLAKIENDYEESNQRSEYQTIQFLKTLEEKEGITFQYITTKFYKELISLKSWHNDFLLKESLVVINQFPFEELMQCIWESRFLYDIPTYGEMFEQSFRPIFRRTLPKQFHIVEPEEEQRRPFKKVLNLMKR